MQTQNLLLTDFIALYLKYHRIEWALTYHDDIVLTLVTGTERELLEYNANQSRWPKAASVFWYQGTIFKHKINWIASIIDLGA
jgi:hypothetical protein